MRSRGASAAVEFAPKAWCMCCMLCARGVPVFVLRVWFKHRQMASGKFTDTVHACSDAVFATLSCCVVVRGAVIFFLRFEFRARVV